MSAIVDCKWGLWTTCKSEGSNGRCTRMRGILKEAKPGGIECQGTSKEDCQSGVCDISGM